MDMSKGRKQETAALSHRHLLLASRTGLDPEKKLELLRSGRIPSCRVELSLPSSIPKHIKTSGEKHAIRCLELIHDHAVRRSSWKQSKVHAFLLESEGTRADAYGKASFLDRSPAASGDDFMIGDSLRMQKILSPLIKQFGSGDLSTCAPVQFRYLLSGEPETTVVEAEDHGLIAAPEERIVSASSMNSCKASLRSSSVFSIQGTLQSKWRDGVLHHVFRTEGRGDAYTATASKVESLNDKALECVYAFYAGKKDRATKGEAIATMRVFTEIILRAGMEQIRETKFILYASGDDHNEEISLHNSSKSRLTRKMRSAFRSGNLMNQRSLSRASLKSVLLKDNRFADHSEDQSSVLSAENNDLPSHEIAAIVLRETCVGPAIPENGGWGLKFLKKPRNDPSLETLEPSGNNTRNNSGCSTSMNVLIPAGLHGKSNSKSAGPSSLVERWISGGGCDCGGWDIGCPLTVLEPKQSNSENSSLGKCKPVHLFTQGLRQDAPVLKMESIRDSLYSIHFQSTLSNLQCFAIAVAVIHSQNAELHCS